MSTIYYTCTFQKIHLHPSNHQEYLEGDVIGVHSIDNTKLPIFYESYDRLTLRHCGMVSDDMCMMGAAPYFNLTDGKVVSNLTSRTKMMSGLPVTHQGMNGIVVTGMGGA